MLVLSLLQPTDFCRLHNPKENPHVKPSSRES
jgi:hypothetical protein